MAEDTGGAKKPKHEAFEPEGKRRNRRAKRRLMVRYGTSAVDHTAFTKNISQTGVFLQTNSVMKPGTTVQVQIQFPERTWSHWARVVWAKKVPPQLAHILECGMGLHFIEPTAEWFAFYGAWKKKTGAD